MEIPAAVLEVEAIYADAVPSISLDEALKRLEPGERGQLRVQLQGMIRQVIPGSDPRPLLEHAIAAVSDPGSKAALQDLLLLLDVREDEAFFARMAELERSRGFTLPLALFRTYQEQLLARPGQQERLEADLRDEDSWKKVWEETRGHRGTPSDESHILDLGEDSAAPVAPSGPATGPRLVFDEARAVALPPRVIESSRALARLFNQLVDGSPARVEIRGLGSRRVASLEELLGLLTGEAGCTVSLHEARAFADFLDASLREEGRLVPIRIPTWIRLPAPEAEALGIDRLPAIHSEILFVVRGAGGRVRALTTWFMSLPAGEAVQGVAFHPAVRRRASWSGYRILRSFEGERARRLFPRIAPTMKTFNLLEERHQLPKSGYGCLSICNDTTAMVAAYLANVGGTALPARDDARVRRLHATAVWPLVRDPRFDFYLARRSGDPALAAALDVGGMLPLLPTDAHPTAGIAPLSPAERRFRIGANLPVRALEALDLPEARARLPRDEVGRADVERGLAFFESF